MPGRILLRSRMGPQFGLNWFFWVKIVKFSQIYVIYCSTELGLSFKEINRSDVMQYGHQIITQHRFRFSPALGICLPLILDLTTNQWYLSNN